MIPFLIVLAVVFGLFIALKSILDSHGEDVHGEEKQLFQAKNQVHR